MSYQDDYSGYDRYGIFGSQNVYRDSQGNVFTSRSERDASTRRLRERRENREKNRAQIAKKGRKPDRKQVVSFRAPIDPSKIKVEFKLEPKQVASAVAPLPKTLQETMKEIAKDTAMNGTMMTLMERVSEFSSPTAAMLAGVALDPIARKHFDSKLDGFWKAQTLPKKAAEVIIGGGLHAAVYCAVRLAQGKPMPLVIERRERVGGAFAVSAAASFYLNSRNRPGPLSIPGEMGALNVLPGAMLQPSDLGGAEYQTNDAFGWVVRLTLAMSASVVAGLEVEEIRADPSGYEIVFKSGERLTADRVILATGLNEPRNRTGLNWSERVMNFEQFMRRMDEPFALKGMDRIAVLGGGDGGKTVIEALTGQGPARQFSIASLDYPTKIDWYGQTLNCEDFAADARPRYRSIARLLPSTNRPQRPYRVMPQRAADGYSEGFNTVYVDDKPYDCIIDATGYSAGTTVLVSPVRDDADSISTDAISFGGRQVALRARYRRGDSSTEDLEVFTIGPAADLALSAAEEVLLRGIAENKTSVFRYASRTATLAANLS